MRIIITLYIAFIAFSGFYSCKESGHSASSENMEIFRKDSTGEASVTILSYNIHHSNPPSRPDYIDVAAIAEVIKKSNADIVGLQEVDVYTERSGTALHMARELAELSGMDYFYFSKAIDYKGGAYGTAILSKYPLSDTLTISLPSAAGTEPRVLSVATVTFDNNRKFCFANTHLDYTDADNNMDQAEHLALYFEEPALPVILTGDFNVAPESKTITYLDQHFVRSCINACSYTSPANNPRRTIDYIMYKGENDFTVEKHQVIRESYASDHLPVKAVLKME
ncbi:endonuclease/exonuclease/phosphatase family protein [Sinomicrobium sp. M5D2P17]